MKITREEYNKALAEFNAKYANADEELARIRKEFSDIKMKAIADGRVKTTRDILDGSYYNDADLTPKEQREVDYLQDKYDDLSKARFQDKENLRKMLKEINDYEAAVRRVSKEVPNADRLSTEQIEEYQRVSKRIQSTQRDINGLKYQIKRITEENTAKIEDLENKLSDLYNQLKEITSNVEVDVEESYTPEFWMEDFLEG